jgi:hypothetical protein
MFLKLVFYVALPGLILVSVPRIEMNINFLALPIIAMVIILVTYVLVRQIMHFFTLPSPSLGVFLIGTLIMNTGFTLPFIIAAYGEEGLARALMFDLGNAILVFTYIYYLATSYGKQKHQSSVLVSKLVSSPPLWALGIGLLMNWLQVQVPTFAFEVFQSLGNMTIPLLMLSLGMYFNPKLVRAKAVFTVLVIRMGLGLLLGYLFAQLFGLQGLDFIIVLLIASSPVGYNTLTFASMEGLDKELASSLISYSFLVGVILAPTIIVLSPI